MREFTGVPPQNIEAEKSILGSMMVDPECIIDILDAVEAGDFFREDHKEIFETIKELSINLQPVDVVSVSEKLKSRGSLDHVGGLERLVEMVNDVPTTANAVNYASIVLEKAKLRRLIKIANNIMGASFEDYNAAEIIDAAEKEILSINERTNSNYSTAAEAALSALEQIEERIRNKGKIMGISTGFADLDRRLGGLQNGDLVLIAARPSMGKTALAENILTYVTCIKQLPGIMFSMEMTKESIVNRIYSSWGRVDNSRIKDGTLTDQDMRNIALVYDRLTKSKLIIDDTPHIRASEMRSKCRRIKNKYGDLRLIVVDHLTEMWRPHKSNRDSVEYEENVRSMKHLGREMNCPVILLQQLSRKVEERPNKRPLLSDLKETGASEEVADVVMFIYRDSYYNPDSDKKNIAEIIVAKSRNGATGTVELNWQGQYTKFSNIDRYQQEQIKV